MFVKVCQGSSRFVKVRQCSSNFVTVRQISSKFVNVRQRLSMFIKVRQCSSMFVDVRQCSSMFVNVRQCSSMLRPLNIFPGNFDKMKTSFDALDRLYSPDQPRVVEAVLDNSFSNVIYEQQMFLA